MQQVRRIALIEEQIETVLVRRVVTARVVFVKRNFDQPDGFDRSSQQAASPLQGQVFIALDVDADGVVVSSRRVGG